MQAKPNITTATPDRGLAYLRSDLAAEKHSIVLLQERQRQGKQETYNIAVRRANCAKLERVIARVEKNLKAETLSDRGVSSILNHEAFIMRKQQDQQNQQFAKALANASIGDSGVRELALKALDFSRRAGRYLKTRRAAVEILSDLDRAANY